MMLVPVRRADRILGLSLAAADFLAVPSVFLLTYWVRRDVIGDAVPGFDVGPGEYLHTIPFLWLFWMVSFASAGLYRPRRGSGGMGELPAMMRALGNMMIIMMAASYLVEVDYSRLMLFIFVAASLPVAVLLRQAARRAASALAPVAEAPRVLIVGTGELAQRVKRSLERLPGRHPVVMAALRAHPGDGGADLEGVPVAGDLSDLPRLIDSMKPDEVFFASSRLPRNRILEVISSIDSQTVHFRVVSDLFEISVTPTDLDDLARLPIIEIGARGGGVLYSAVKRTADILLSLLLIALLSPLLALVYIILALGGKGSPIFRQVRTGRNGRPFTLLKFRTMKPETGEYEVAPVRADDPRITGFGRFLRRTSLDELPQLFNVLGGSMSMVGPRPEMPFIVQGYSAWQRRRLEVRPGLTGLWQIMGRKDLPLHDNLEYDFYYIRNRSLMLDLAIILRTVATVFRGRGAY